MCHLRKGDRAKNCYLLEHAREMTQLAGKEWVINA